MCFSRSRWARYEERRTEDLWSLFDRERAVPEPPREVSDPDSGAERPEVELRHDPERELSRN